MLLNFILGILSGFSIATFFIGKELYRYYLRNKIQNKQIERLKLLRQITKKLK